MEKPIVQQEILLMTGTGFAAGELCKVDYAYTRPSHQLSQREALEEACWNGLLQIQLPGLCMQRADGGDLYLWEIQATGSFLKLDLGEAPVAIDDHFSIAPHSFLSQQSLN